MEETKMEEKKRFHFKFPSNVVMLFIIICFVVFATYVVPAGKFDTTTNAQGMQMVVADSYHHVAQSPVNPFRLFVSIQEGFINGAQIIFLILFGYFWVYSVLQTGAFTAMIRKLMGSRIKDSKLFIPIVMLVFALAGSTYGEFETVYGLVPIFVALAIVLGYDALVGMCMCGMAVAVGFASATTNPFTIGIAQSFAGLPLFSGMALRWVAFVVFCGISIAWVMVYANKIKKDPSKSLLTGLDYSAFQLDLDSEEAQNFTVTHKILMLGMVVTIVLIVFGSLKLGWYINEMSGMFLISGLISSIIARKGPEQIATNLRIACSEMTIAMLVVGMSRTILVVLQNGSIVDSVIHYMNQSMEGLPAWATSEMMLVVQNILNFFIPSGSGQAAAIMPIMVPLADLAHVSRQVAVLAYQFGDGYSNLIWPAGACAILCGIAKIPLGKWYRFFLPCFGVLFVAQVVFIFIATAIHYGPF